MSEEDKQELRKRTQKEILGMSQEELQQLMQRALEDMNELMK